MILQNFELRKKLDFAVLWVCNASSLQGFEPVQLRAGKASSLLDIEPARFRASKSCKSSNLKKGLRPQRPRACKASKIEGFEAKKGLILHGFESQDSILQGFEAAKASSMEGFEAAKVLILQGFEAKG